MSMSWSVLVILVSAGYAAWRGFLSETLSIFAWVAAAFAMSLFRALADSPDAQHDRHALAGLAWRPMPAVFLVVFIPLSFISPPFLRDA